MTAAAARCKSTRVCSCVSWLLEWRCATCLAAAAALPTGADSNPVGWLVDAMGIDRKQAQVRRQDCSREP